MDKLINNPLIGADIEVFLQHKKTKQIVSAEGYVKGTKYNPFCFDESNPFFALSLDNVLAEFGIPPASNKEEWVSYIKKSLNYLSESIPNRFCIAPQPSAILAPRFLQTENAKRFGCEPDLNVWLRKPNKSPKPSNPCLRSGGGHIHIGYDNPDMVVNEFIIKAMDLFIGVPSVLQEPDNDRKMLYGKAGAFRWKDYGVEYRTVSNYYLQTDRLLEWTYDSTQKALEFVNDNRAEEVEAVASQIQEAINSANKVLAGQLIRQFDLELA